MLDPRVNLHILVAYTIVNSLSFSHGGNVDFATLEIKLFTSPRTKTRGSNLVSQVSAAERERRFLLETERLIR